MAPCNRYCCVGRGRWLGGAGGGWEERVRADPGRVWVPLSESLSTSVGPARLRASPRPPAALCGRSTSIRAKSMR